jgi:hypothetical protein
MGKHVYLFEDNAEEVLGEVVSLIKNKVASESRYKAFDECTKFWQDHYRKEVFNILSDNCPKEAKLSRIRQLFEIEYNGE